MILVCGTNKDAPGRDRGRFHIISALFKPGRASVVHE